MFELDGWSDKCGVVGVIVPEPEHRVLPLLYTALFGLQHRGQESAGLALANGQHVKVYKQRGTVTVAFPPPVLESLSAFPDPCFGIGHVRYATQGDSDLRSAQPHYIEPASGRVVLVSNGDVANYWTVRRWLESEGVEINTENDAELLLKVIDYYRCKFNLKLIDAIVRMSDQVRGTWSAILMTRQRFIVFRDRIGNRPMCWGKLGQSLIFASETCVLDGLGAEYAGEVEPGSITEYDQEGTIVDQRQLTTGRWAHCVFERIYFARPDSYVFGGEAGRTRHHCGRCLARRYPVEADFVTPVPDSGNLAAVGLAEEAGIPFRLGLVRNPFIGRTFTTPGQDNRVSAVSLKLNPMHGVWGRPGKLRTRAVVVDDSIVRGTTTRHLIAMLRRACLQKTGQAAVIHLRIAAPPVRYPCYYGIDTPTREELIAAQHERNGGVDTTTIARYLGVDSLEYLTLADLRSCLEQPENYCYACFDGNYPIGTKDTREV